MAFVADVFMDDLLSEVKFEFFVLIPPFPQLQESIELLRVKVFTLRRGYERYKTSDSVEYDM